MGKLKNQKTRILGKQKTRKREIQKTAKMEKQKTGKVENWKNGLTLCKISNKFNEPILSNILESRFSGKND